MTWLLPDSKLRIILFIVGDSRCETETGFSVIVMVGKPLKANGSGNIISLLNLSLYFPLFQWFQYFFKNSFRKKLSTFFCTFDTSFHFQLFLYDYVHVFVLQTSIILSVSKAAQTQSGYSVKDDLLFHIRDMSIARQNICYCHIFPLNKFFD